MKKIAASLTVLALLVSPSYAGAGPICASSSQPDSYDQSLIDDPAVPNCVMRPSAPYPNGVCERVQQWTNYGGQSLFCVEPN